MVQTGAGKLLSGLGGIGGAISIGSSLLGLLGGIGQQSKGRKMLAGLNDPGYQIPKEVSKNLLDYEQLARTGLPQEQYNLASTNIQRGTQLGLRRLNRMSNPFAGISSIQRNENDAFSQLDVADAAARRQNILGAMGARRELAAQKLAKQQYNQRRYEESVNEANALMGAGQQNFAGGLGALGQFGMMQSLYGNRNNPTQSQTTTGVKLPSSSVLNNPGVRPYVPTTINYFQKQSAPAYTGPFPTSGTGNLGMFGLPTYP
jgi:hypothetical protein